MYLKLFISAGSVQQLNQFMMNSNSLQDEMLKSYIESVFNKYDTDKNGALDIQEMTLFFNDLFRNLGINTVVTEAQSLQAIKSIDQNSDGMVDRQELFKAFKLMLNPPQRNYPPPNQNYNNYGNGSNGGQGGYGNYQGQGNMGYGPNQGYNQNQGYYQGGYNQGYPPNNQGYMNYSGGYGGYGGGYPGNNGPMYNTSGARYPPNNEYGGQYNSYNPYRR